jgi:hypothetical protein
MLIFKDRFSYSDSQSTVFLLLKVGLLACKLETDVDLARLDKLVLVNGSNDIGVACFS